MTSGSGKRIRNKGLTIRLSDEERAFVDAAAENAGLTPGSYARNLLLGTRAPRSVRRRPLERRELVRLLGQVAKVGSNLNQLTKTAHMGLLLYEDEIRLTLGGLRVLRDELLVALGRAP